LFNGGEGGEVAGKKRILVEKREREKGGEVRPSRLKKEPEGKNK